MKLSKNSTVLILSHFYEKTVAGGSPHQELKDFLLPKVKKVYYIEHPFPYATDHRSSMAIYEKGILKKQFFTPPITGPQAIFYILDPIFTFYFLMRAKSSFDLCVALDNLNTVSVLPFKKLGIIKKLIFYTIDFTPKRFENKLLNLFYHLFDRIACYTSDVIWVTSKRAIEGRIKNGINEKKSAPSIILPLGAKLDRINMLPIQKINKYQIAFVGHLIEKQGLQIVLKSLPYIIDKIPKVKLVIIGRGEYEKKLKFLTKELKIAECVEFKGFVKDHKIVEKILCNSRIGVAPYQPFKESYTFYGDPNKPKLYLACGLPIVITNVPEFASIIGEKKAGFVVDYTVESISGAILTLLSNDSLYKTYRKNAISLSKEFSTDVLIENALTKSLPV